MKMYFMALWIMLLADSTLSDNLDSNHNVYCRPVSSVVPVKQDGLPYFVTLQRCQGSLPGHNPFKKECVANVSNTVDIEVTISNKPKHVKMENHTECTGRCVYSESCKVELFNRNEDDCSCTCKYKTPPTPCPRGTRWNPTTCRCDCILNLSDAPRANTYKLDKEQCEFVCLRQTCSREGFIVDPAKRCYCVAGPQALKRENDKSNHSALLPALLIGEFVILYLIFDFLLYSKKTGLMYYAKTKCSRTKHDHASHETERKPENGTDNTPLTVCVDQNGTSKIHVTSI